MIPHPRFTSLARFSAGELDDPARGRHLVRFAFCKRPEVLAEAIRRLGGLAAPASMQP